MNYDLPGFGIFPPEALLFILDNLSPLYPGTLTLAHFPSPPTFLFLVQFSSGKQRLYSAEVKLWVKFRGPGEAPGSMSLIL